MRYNPLSNPLQEPITMIDLDELRQRIDAIRTGALPQSAVTDDELIAAIEQLRAARRAKQAPAPKSKPQAAPAGSLLDLLSQIPEE